VNELQKTERELLKYFLEVCDRLELNYYLICGTALGAVKYGGFIPWDDDIDVALFREDYEAFLRKAPAMLPEYIFLQNYRTDPAFPQIFSKLRDSRTTYMEESSAKLPINHGVYIDIFPLDGYPKHKKDQQKLERKKTRYKRQLACCFDVNRGFSSQLLCAMNRLFGCKKNSAKIAKKYETLVSSYPIGGSQLICNHGNWQGQLEYASQEQYGKGTQVKFEGLDVRVPEKYDEYLTQKYGNWRADLPKEQQVGHHYYSVLDLKRPYTEYINR